MKKRKIKTKKEFSKKLASAILIVALIDIQLTYVLAFLGLSDIAETLSVALVTEVVGVYGIYCLKAYMGKKNEVESEQKQAEFEYKKDWEDLKL